MPTKQGFTWLGSLYGVDMWLETEDIEIGKLAHNYFEDTEKRLKEAAKTDFERETTSFLEPKL